MQNGEIEHSDKSPEKRRTLLVILCFFVGTLGVHRFMTGKWKSGLFQFFTLGGLWIWWLVDLVMLLTGSFTDTDGIPFKEKIEEYKDEHPEIYDGYENVGFGKWLLLVELPWILLIVGLLLNAYSTSENYVAAYGSDSICFYASVAVMQLAILFIVITIGFKNKIRAAKGMKATKNPYTWFTSYIGKALGGTLVFTLGIGVFICIALFFSSAKVGADSFVSNGKRGEGGKAADSSARKNSNVSTNYYCEYCGYKSSSISSLTMAPCFRHPDGSNKGKHKLYEGSEKSQYTCKYCGYKSSSISSLTMAPCFRHPDGSNKGKHSPAL